jgi:hypothetical protein
MFDDPIENKKNEKESKVKNMNWKKFSMTFFGHFLVTICFFTVVIGACGLYTSKVAQSNILPFNPEFAPYTSEDYKMGEADKAATVLMNIVKGRGWKGFNFFDDPTGINAQNATFIKENFDENGIFSFFCKIKAFSEQNENFSRMTFFLRKIFISGILSSFDMVNTIYSVLYSLPEWLLMVVYFTIFPFIFIFLIFWNAFKIFLEAISNIIIPFRVNNPKVGATRTSSDIVFGHVERDPEDLTSQWWRKWTQCEINEYNKNHKGIWNTITEFMDYIGYGIMFMIYAMITFNIIIPISIFVTMFSLFNPLLRKYKLEKDPKDKENGFIDFLRDTFAYKKSFIIILAAYNLIISTGLYLPKAYTFSCFIGILVLAFYFEVFAMPDSDKIFADDATQIIINTSEGLPAFIKVDQVTMGLNTFNKCKDKVELAVKPLATKPQTTKSQNNVNPEGKGALIPGQNTNNKKPAHQQKVFNAEEYNKKRAEIEADKIANAYIQPQFVPSITPAITPITPPIPTTTSIIPTIPTTTTTPTTPLTKGGAKRNKGGELHKKYNFSLI